MAILTKKELTELAGGDMYSSGGDRNATWDSEIETGPVDKPFNDYSNYKKGFPTTGDKVFSRYRQNIPWFAVYSFGGNRSGLPLTGLYEDDSSDSKTVKTKRELEEEVMEVLVKKINISDINEKNYNPKFSKLMDSLSEMDLNDSQIEEIMKAITNKHENKTKNI
jgi:hypothetical protein